MASGRRRSFWAWGYEDRLPHEDERARLATMSGNLLGLTGTNWGPLPALEQLVLPESRLQIPERLREIASTTTFDRATHCYGRGFRDVVRGFSRDFASAPDVVLRPTSEDSLPEIFAWAEKSKVALIPYGGGTSVVGGVEMAARAGYAGVATIDMGRFDRVLDVDRESLSARIEAGATGPALEAQLAEHGLTLRHFPQSFELSTLGGWIATRAGGHFATRYTHIDDLTQSVRMLTPRGPWQSLRVPGSGAGPSPDRWVLGSEGALGVITEAWVRVRPRPEYRASASIRFAALEDAVKATRALAQSGLEPTNCRLLDSREALLHQVTLDGSHVLLVAFESACVPVDTDLQRALELIADFGGQVKKPTEKERSEDTSAWRSAFIDGPYLLNTAISIGLIVDTFETAVTWAGFEHLRKSVKRAALDCCRRVCGGGLVTMRFSHVYPDGPAPYFTVLAPGRKGSRVEQWTEIKAAISEAIHNCGGTITHHHAVGRTHRPWYDKQRPQLFADALKATKGHLDPASVLNPGVLIG